MGAKKIQAQLGYPFYFNAEMAGASLKRVAVDTLHSRGQQIESWLYQNDQGVDLLIWINSDKKIIKQRFNIFGQVVEWNVVEGVKTGMTVDFGYEKQEAHKLEDSDLKARVYGGKRAHCVYDERNHPSAVSQVLDVLKWCDIKDELKDRVIHNFQQERKVKVIDEVKLPTGFKGFSWWARVKARIATILVR